MFLELQKELFKLFEVHLNFQFYDGLQDKGFPYGSFGYCTVDDNDTKTTKGDAIFMQLDLYSNYNGKKEVKEMIEAVRTVLRQPITVENKEVILISSHALIQQEESINHGIIEVTFKIY